MRSPKVVLGRVPAPPPAFTPGQPPLSGLALPALGAPEHRGGRAGVSLQS